MESEILRKVAEQREMLKTLLASSMGELAQRCAGLMNDPQALDDLLFSHFSDSSYCKYLWVLDQKAIQVSATVARDKRLEEQRGRDRAARPYVQRALQGERFYLSDAYISRNRRRPSLTSMHVICDEHGHTIGFLGVDFDLRQLPHTAQLKLDKQGWSQWKGDPAIRGGLFSQSRIESAMDVRIDDVMSLIEEMIFSHGVFHAKFHFSSSRATLWLVDDPYDYQVLHIDELIDPSLCLAFPKRQYFERARVSRKDVRRVFAQFRKLRFADETIYLRSASLNVVNQIVGLNFSCDGSHYVKCDKFLQKDNDFWFGVK